MRDLPPALNVLARDQAQVLSRGQLRGYGVTPQAVAWRARAGRWQTFGGHAVLLHNAAPTFMQRCWIAVVNCGAQRGLLAGRTAASLLGLRDYESQSVHLLVGGGSRVPVERGVVQHRTRRDLVMAEHPTRRPPMTRLDRALLDAAAWSANLDDACAVLASGVQQGLTTAARLTRELADIRRLASRKLILSVLDDIAGGSQSLAELDLVRLCRAEGLPVPIRQAVRDDGFGRRRYLDAEFTYRDRPGTFAVEVDGGFHLQPAQYWDDMRRSNGVAISGSPVLRFPAVSLRLHPAESMAQLRAMYES